MAYIKVRKSVATNQPLPSAQTILKTLRDLVHTPKSNQA